LLLPSGENVGAMAPNPAGTGSSAERQYHGANNGKAVVAKMPGTPHRRDTGGHGHSREKAVQDPGLKDYVGTLSAPSCNACFLFSDIVHTAALPALEFEVTGGDFDARRLVCCSGSVRVHVTARPLHTLLPFKLPHMHP
jgi:hypothetical protein